MSHMTYPAQAEHTLALTQGSILPIPTHEIYSDKPQSTPKDSKIIRLVQNIRKYGLTAPITVSPRELFPGKTRYLILEGEELWRAACLVELAHIPCLIASNTPREAEIGAILTKISSKTADMFEKAALFRHLMDAYALTQEEISRRTGLSQSAIANKIRLLNLSAAEQERILLHGLSERHARALVRLKSPQARLSALEAICRQNLSVADTEALIEGKFLPKPPVFASKGAEKPVFTPSTPPEPPVGACTPMSSPAARKSPKFVLHTLQPLYNSLERTLAIFRKTGRSAILASEETDGGLVITIRIPNP